MSSNLKTPDTYISAAKIGTYFNERGKSKVAEPMFSREYLLPGDEIMVYDYDLEKHMRAVIINDVMPEVLEFRTLHDKLVGSYSAKEAIKMVEGTEIPRVYRVSY